MYFYVQISTPDSAKQDIYLIQIIILNSNNVINETTPFITPTKSTVLINKSFKAASQTCFGTSVPSSGRIKCHLKKMLSPRSSYLLGFSVSSSLVVDVN